MSEITGRGWDFPPHLDERNNITMVEDDTLIRNAILIILNTARGERVMRPEFGCDIHEMIFSPANQHTAATVERLVSEAIKRWEPRIILREVRVTPGQAEWGELLIEISYQIKSTHDVRSLVYPFYLTPA
ncbi:MAG: GPW/gp25 family protein [Chloroflexi bacterium]|nr:GPW/gp25 family protein [Chloroflexota bacterium]